MDSTRQNKSARLLHKEISDIFMTEGRGYYGHSMVTVTRARVTPDLSVAKIYLSIFVIGENDKKEVLKNINLHTKEIRWHLGHRVKHQLRIIPELEFFIDDSLDYIENIENLLKK
jgi:ribosome-binding factor A